MARIVSEGKNVYIHLTVDDIKKVIVTRVNGGGRNFYGVYDLIHGNEVPISEELAMECIDAIKSGKICDVYHAFNFDTKPNFEIVKNL